MQKINLELPKYSLELHLKLTKRRKPLVAEPLVPSIKRVNRKYRKGSTVGKFARYISEHKSARKIMAANLAGFVIASTFLPFSNPSLAQAAPEDTVIETQNTLTTEKAIQFPLPFVKVNQGFSYFHPAVDLGAPVGTAVMPVKGGIVIFAGYTHDGYGNNIVIDHGKGLTSLYAHLSKIEVANGETVNTNMEIGKVGLTGHTTGPHLHLEIRINGTALNPLTVLPR